MRAMRIRVNDGVGSFTAVVGKPGRIYTPYVKIDSHGTGVAIIRRHMANGDVEAFASPLMKGDKPYPMTKAVNHMLRIGRKRGITKSARALLKEAGKK
ncbi:hypothetical protein LCGC14_0373430 [marine sediment metagenome]|uniref:Uncharacterized protein n=1 Tax=marine sediment metagenome TaxID=412755 RepID=A0A0F9WD39_9ZZZZ